MSMCAPKRQRNQNHYAGQDDNRSVGGSPAATLRADDKALANKGVEGSWEGRLAVTPEIELRITLEVTKAKDGSLSGKWGSPDQAQKDLPLDSIAEINNTAFSTQPAKKIFRN